jgi:hypothetical protein
MRAVDLLFYSVLTIAACGFGITIFVNPDWTKRNKAIFSVALAVMLFIGPSSYRLSTGRDASEVISEVLLCPVYNFLHCPGQSNAGWLARSLLSPAEWLVTPAPPTTWPTSSFSYAATLAHGSIPADMTLRIGTSENAPSGWGIQIGAFEDAELAGDQLATYANANKDLIGNAQLMIASKLGAHGHTLFLARFVQLSESDARAICGKLTIRGQTCFAVKA